MYFDESLFSLKFAKKYKTGAYGISFLEETDMHDMSIPVSDVPAYALRKKFQVGDILTLGDMCGHHTYQRTAVRRIFKRNLDEKYKIIDIVYAKFPRWQFWNNNKYPTAYWTERVDD